jgi:hypothetical protein
MKTELGQGHGSQYLYNQRLSTLQDYAKRLNIPTIVVTHFKIEKGWVGTNKGLLQLLWERGFIDTGKMKQYQLKVVGDNGDLVPEFSLVHTLEQCNDFANESTQLEYVCDLGEIFFTPAPNKKRKQRT